MKVFCFDKEIYQLRHNIFLFSQEFIKIVHLVKLVEYHQDSAPKYIQEILVHISFDSTVQVSHSIASHGSARVSSLVTHIYYKNEDAL